MRALVPCAASDDRKRLSQAVRNRTSSTSPGLGWQNLVEESGIGSFLVNQNAQVTQSQMFQSVFAINSTNEKPTWSDCNWRELKRPSPWSAHTSVHDTSRTTPVTLQVLPKRDLKKKHAVTWADTRRTCFQDLERNSDERIRCRNADLRGTEDQPSYFGESLPRLGMVPQSDWTVADVQAPDLHGCNRFLFQRSFRI